MVLLDQLLNPLPKIVTSKIVAYLRFVEDDNGERMGNRPDEAVSTAP